MTKSDFLRLQGEDIRTSDNPMFKPILECFEMHIPGDADISEDKSVKGMYNFMYNYAKKNRGGSNTFCIDPFDGFKKIMFEYLGIKESKETISKVSVSLEDIFS